MTATIENDVQIRSRLQGKDSSTGMVALCDLTVDIRVQQPLRPGKVAAMQKQGFDLALTNVITVSDRGDGTHVVLDGQTRVECARNVGVKQLQAVVWYGLTLADEAWLFAYLNKKSNPPAIQTFRARVNADEAGPNAILDTLYEFGWELSESGGSADGKFLAVATAERIYGRNKEFRAKGVTGDEMFTKVVRIITMAWGHKKDAMDNVLIAGLAALLARYWDQIDVDLLIRKLGHEMPIEVKAGGRRARTMTGLSPSLSQAWHLHSIYNRQLRSGRLAAFVPKI